MKKYCSFSNLCIIYRLTKNKGFRSILMFNFFKDWLCFINCLKKIKLHIMVWSYLHVRHSSSVIKQRLSNLRVESSNLHISTNFFSYLMVQNIVAIWFAQNIRTFTTKIKRDLLMLHKTLHWLCLLIFVTFFALAYEIFVDCYEQSSESG